MTDGIEGDGRDDGVSVLRTKGRETPYLAMTLSSKRKITVATFWDPADSYKYINS